MSIGSLGGALGRAVSGGLGHSLGSPLGTVMHESFVHVSKGSGIKALNRSVTELHSHVSTGRIFEADSHRMRLGETLKRTSGDNLRVAVTGLGETLQHASGDTLRKAIGTANAVHKSMKITVNASLAKETARKLSKTLTKEQKDYLFRAAVDLGVEGGKAYIRVKEAEAEAEAEQRRQMAMAYASSTDEQELNDAYRSGYEQGLAENGQQCVDTPTDVDVTDDTSDDSAAIEDVLSKLTKEELLLLIGETLNMGEKKEEVA